MIAFISEYPTVSNEQDGMLQRIKTVDKIFENHERVYITFSYLFFNSPEIVKVSDKLTLYKFDLSKKKHLIAFYEIIQKTTLIYVHSVYNARYILPLYKYKKIITDMHGAVPEEQIFWGSSKNGLYYNEIERFVVKNSYKIVSVTNAMAEHFKTKYSNELTDILILPIFDDNYLISKISKSNKEKIVIYSGGVQKWQNIDLMIKCISCKINDYQYLILTGNVEIFKEKLSGIDYSKKVQIKSVSRKDLNSYYSIADFGFILRDDLLLNRVACPTKLSEYLSYGIIPIVKYSLIGDFSDLGYKYITYNHFCEAGLPHDDEIKKIRENNYSVSLKLKDLFEKGKTDIIQCLACLERNPYLKNEISERLFYSEMTQNNQIINNFFQSIIVLLKKIKKKLKENFK